MTELILKTGKKNGRPRRLSEAEERELAYLYFALEWTAPRIKAARFPGLSEGSIRSIAWRVRKQAERVGTHLDTNTAPPEVEPVTPNTSAEPTQGTTL